MRKVRFVRYMWCGAGGAMNANLVHLEAWNVTRFILVTNKRRENAGASELITYLDGKWVLDALRVLFPGFTTAWRIEDAAAELLLSGAGSADLLVRSADLAKELVTAVTLSALREAPGLDVCGMVTEVDWSHPGSLALAKRLVHERFDDALAGRPGPEHRFQPSEVGNDAGPDGRAPGTG